MRLMEIHFQANQIHTRTKEATEEEKKQSDVHFAEKMIDLQLFGCNGIN